MRNLHTPLPSKKRKRRKNDNVEFIGSGKQKPQHEIKKLKIKEKYGNSLLMFIRDKNIFKLNRKGELLKQNVPIKKSNLKKLILHAVSRKIEKPIGYIFFYDTLKEFKIPNYLLINNLKKYTRDAESSPWRPPGELYINKNDSLK